MGAQARYLLDNLTSPTFTCTVSGQTATVGISGSDYKGTLKVTTNAASGAVVGLSEHMLTSGGPGYGYEGSVEATTVYAAQSVAKPTKTVSQHKYNVATAQAMERLLVQSIVKAASPKVKKQPTAAKRVKALRSVVNARVKAFNKAYDFMGGFVIKVTNTSGGIRVKLNTHINGVAPQIAKIVVKGSNLVVTYL